MPNTNHNNGNENRSYSHPPPPTPPNPYDLDKRISLVERESENQKDEINKIKGNINKVVYVVLSAVILALLGTIIK